MNRFTSRILPLIALLGIATSYGLAQVPTPVTKEQRDEVLERVTKIISTSAFVPGVDFGKWPQFLETEREEIDRSTTANDFALAVNKALQKFGASHIVFNTPDAAKQLREGKVVGIGISPALVTDGIKINDVFPGSSAAKAGIEVGDIILEANGKKPETIASLRGTEGTSVKLKIRKATGKVVTLTVERRPFSINVPETLKWVNKDVAVLKVPSFMSYNAKNVESLVTQAQKAKTLVIDLRSNGGGQVIALLHLSALVLPQKAEMGSWITRRMVDEYVKEKGGKPTDLAAIAASSSMKVTPFVPKVPRFEGKVIGLINGGSGSASEIFAAALHEVIGAPLVGSKSAGQVLASIIAPVPHGYQLQYPFQDYVTAKGVRLEGNGVKPDIEAATPRSPSDEDPAIKAVLKLLGESKAASSTKSGA